MAKRQLKLISGYMKDDTMSLTKRVAHFLDWLATARPGEFAAFNVIIKAIMGYDYMPRLDGPEVQRIKSMIASNVKTALLAEYDREIVSLPGVGVRATYSAADRLEHVAPKRARRLATARRNFMVTANAIDLRDVPDTPAYAGLKQWMKREVGDVLKLIGSPEFERKLLPPSTVTSSEKK